MSAKVVSIPSNGNLGQSEIQELAAAIKGCKILAFPTDTVYGLGTTGLIKAGLRRIYQIKGRDSLKPLPILVPSVEAAKRWVEWTPTADSLARKFWPGALTLVLAPTKEGRLLTFQEFRTLAIRIPAHPTLAAILKAAEVPMASTSANKSGQPALAAGTDVVAQFKDLVDYILDGGPCAGTESTVVDATEPSPRVLREGKIKRDEIMQEFKVA